MKKVNQAGAFILALVIIFSISIIAVHALATDGIVLNFKFDKDFNDTTGNNNNATKSGDVQFVKDSIFGDCVEFNGGHLSINDSDSLKLGKNFTISTWVKLSSTSDEMGPILERLRSDQPSLALNFTVVGTDEIRSFIYDQESNIHAVSKSQIPLLEGWTLSTLTYDGMDLKLYANGKLVSSVENPQDQVNNPLIASQTRFFIAKDQNSNFFRGRMSDFRIYNKTLSEDDILFLYKEKITWTNKIKLWIGKHTMEINGTQKDVDPGKLTSPVIVENRTLVPIRSIIETMGGTVNWISSDRMVEITLESRTIKLWINKTTSMVDGKNIPIDVAPIIMEGRTMLPLRFISESLGVKIEWISEKQEISLLY
jgi:hypothetical protein